MILDVQYAEYALAAYDHPIIIVENSAARVDIVDGLSLVSVAGTNDGADVIDDLFAMPWKPKELGVFLHKGMWNHTKKLIKPIMSEIYLNGLPVALTGHSLAGQATGYLAALMLSYGIDVVNWTTFGMPRGGYSGYNELTKNIAGKRFVREGDTVADIPTILPWSHDRPATMLEGAEGVIDHRVSGYIAELSG